MPATSFITPKKQIKVGNKNLKKDLKVSVEVPQVSKDEPWNDFVQNICAGVEATATRFLNNALEGAAKNGARAFLAAIELDDEGNPDLGEKLPHTIDAALAEAQRIAKSYTPQDASKAIQKERQEKAVSFVDAVKAKLASGIQLTNDELQAMLAAAQ